MKGVTVSDLKCGHNPSSRDRTMVIQGKEYLLRESPLCHACTEKYLNEASTVCATCGGPIVPDDLVAISDIHSPFPYTHATAECSDDPGLWCGKWGVGTLIALHELNPEEFPEGTPSLMGLRCYVAPSREKPKKKKRTAKS